MCKTKLLGNWKEDGASGIPKNATIDVLLKSLSTFWRSLSLSLTMSLIN